MFEQKKNLLCVIFAFFSSFIISCDVDAAESNYLSPLYVEACQDGNELYIAQAAAQQIAFYDIGAEEVTGYVAIAGPASGICLSPDGTLLYASSGIYDGLISVIDISSRIIKDVIEVGHSPIAPVITPDGKTLYVSSRVSDNVLAVNLTTKKIIAEIAVTREPAAAAMTADGKKLFVANFLPAGRVDRGFAAAVVTVIDTELNESVETVTLPNGSINLRDLVISPDGKYVYVSHILARYQLPATQLERGWMNTNAMTIINARTNRMLTTVLLDDVDLGAANPWGLACTADGRFVCVVHSGTHEISVIDRLAMHEKIDKIAKGRKVSDVSFTLEDVPNDLSFLAGLRRRIKLEGDGPRNITLVGTKAYITEYFTDSLGIVDIDPAFGSAVKSIKLGADIEMNSVRKGEMYFYDASLCFQKWQSCASCHPADGRADALNWDLLNDGMGNPKNTRSLLLSHKTPPSMISGVRDSAEVGVRSGIRFIQFVVRPEEDARAIDDYLKSLEPIPSPRLIKNKKTGKLILSKAAERGKKIFKNAGCMMCHSGSYFTNLQKYDVGTGKGREEGMAYDTPTLIETWRSAPYLHDGRAATMKEVFRDFNMDNKHGNTTDLTDQQINDLVEYVLSL